MDLDLAIFQLVPTAAYRLSVDKQSILEWRGPGAQPTVTDLQAAWTAYQAAQTTKASDAATMRSAVVTVAQSAVGVGINSLTAVQVRALLACLLFKAGGIDKAGVVLPLVQWL